MDLGGPFLFGRGNSGNRKGNGSWVNAQAKNRGEIGNENMGRAGGRYEAIK